jgi:hypothetical protein
MSYAVHADRASENYGLLDRRDTPKVLKALLLNDSIKIVGHNIAYDFTCLMASYPELTFLIFEKYRKGLVTDTLLRQQLIYIAYGMKIYGKSEEVQRDSLEELAKEYLGIDMDGKSGPDSWRLRYSELYGVPLEQWPREAARYAKFDSRVTLQIYLEQDRLYRQWLVDDPFQTYAYFILRLIANSGMQTSFLAVRRLITKELKVMKRLAPRLKEARLLEWDRRKRRYIKKRKRAQEYIARACELVGREPLLTDKGQVSIDHAAARWADSAIMLDRAEYSTAEKMITTYAPLVREGYTLPIGTEFGLAVTGRTTSRTPREPMVGGNFQNLPSRRAGVRECFVPRPGYVYLAGDFKGAELHSLAQATYELLGWTVLGDVLNAGQDLHLYVGAKLLGMTYEQAYEIRHMPRVIKERDNGKRANFGFAGAMAHKGFIRSQLKDGKVWSEMEAKELRRLWFEALPCQRAYQRECRSRLDSHGRAVMKAFFSGRYRAVKGLPTICNGYFQSLTADGAKLAIAEVVRRCYVVPTSALYRAKPVNFVHDELILEVREDDKLQEAVREFKKVLADEFNRTVPRYPTEVDACLMRHWSKRAKAEYNKKGEMIPWET